MGDLNIILTILLALLLIGAALVLIMIPYLYLSVSVFPWLCMHPVYRGGRKGDRGVRRVTYPGGDGVVYTPDPRVRRYLSQYALFTHEGGKYIRCRIDARIAYLGYDVLTFDRRGKLLDIVSVEERPETAGETHPVRLPTATAHVRLLLRRVDGVEVDNSPYLRYHGWGMLALILCHVAINVVYALVVRSAWVAVSANIDLPVPISSAACVLLAVLLGLAYSAWVIFRYHGIETRRWKK